MLAVAGCGDGGGSHSAQSATCAPGLTASSSDDVCFDATDPRAQELIAAVRNGMTKDILRASIFGVWIGDRELVTGAIGESRPGRPATRDMHFPISNTTEAITSTVLLRLVDQQRVALSAPVSTWFPSLPNADAVTVQMLASSTSGYVDYVTTPAFVAAFDANPFRHWQPQELFAFSAGQTPLFAPGTSWAFSDSNFVLLGEVLTRIGGQPLGELVRTEVLDPLGLRDTTMRVTPNIRPPVLHGYTVHDGKYVDATFWNPTWATGTGNMVSNLSDLHEWAIAVGTGSLLSPASHQLQVGPENAGLGPLTPDRYYGMGLGVASSWIFSNPHPPGYSGFVTYFPSEKIVVVIFATPGPGNLDDMNYAQDVFLDMAEILTPDNVPNIGQRTD
jgi:D-alanyl-D-alanine carboxypeptidase